MELINTRFAIDPKMARRRHRVINGLDLIFILKAIFIFLSLKDARVKSLEQY
jgi:hypothetical protein